MTKLPENLQKRIDELARSFDMLACESWQEEQEAAFKEGASAMHSIMLEELEPVIKVLEFASIENVSCREALFHCKQALSHYRERIEGVK